ncbi:hypothetical protein Bbelb_435190 [Branchiostoma belcheri]|nr:hypothetical protein Bbelb_435190 [Branchiostoma belcheri]
MAPAPASPARDVGLRRCRVSPGKCKTRNGSMRQTFRAAIGLACSCAISRNQLAVPLSPSCLYNYSTPHPADHISVPVSAALHGSLRACDGGRPPLAARVVVRERKANEIRELENVSNSRKKPSREGRVTPAVTLELGGGRSYGHDSTDSNQNARRSIRLRTHTNLT